MVQSAALAVRGWYVKFETKQVSERSETEPKCNKSYKKAHHTLIVFQPLGQQSLLPWRALLNQGSPTHLIVLNADSKITVEYIYEEQYQVRGPCFLKPKAKNDMDSRGSKTLPVSVMSSFCNLSAKLRMC